MENGAPDRQHDKECDHASNRSIQDERKDTLPKWIWQEEERDTCQSTSRSRLHKDVNGIVVYHWHVNVQKAEKPHANECADEQPHADSDTLNDA